LSKLKYKLLNFKTAYSDFESNKICWKTPIFLDKNQKRKGPFAIKEVAGEFKHGYFSENFLEKMSKAWKNVFERKEGFLNNSIFLENV